MRKTIAVTAVLILAVLPSVPVVMYGQESDRGRLHIEDDQRWAGRSGLTVGEIRELRKLVGLSDRSSDLIDNVDAKTLEPYHLVLFATYGGSARCVIVWLFARTDDSFREFWSSPEAGDDLSFCADPKCETPLATAKPNRDVEIEIPSMHTNRCAVDSVALFKWIGDKYSYKGLVKRKPFGKQ